MPSKRIVTISSTSTDAATTAELYYHANQYDTFILSVIPSTYLEHYKSLSKDDKERALEEITELLFRIQLEPSKEEERRSLLELASDDDEEQYSIKTNTTSGSTTKASFDIVPKYHRHHQQNKARAITNTHYENKEQREPQKLLESEIAVPLYTQRQDDDSCCSSVEVERRAAARPIHDPDETILLSPPLLRTPTSVHFNHDDDGSIILPTYPEEEEDAFARRKRNATTSGKKGLDLQRLRLEQDNILDLHHRNYLFTSDDILESPFSPLLGRNTTIGNKGVRQHSLSLMLQSQSPIVASEYDNFITSNDANDTIKSPRNSNFAVSSSTGSPSFNDEEVNSRKNNDEEFFRTKGTTTVISFQKNINLNKSRFGIHDGVAAGNSKTSTLRMHPEGGGDMFTDDTIQTVDCTMVERRRQLRLATLKRVKHPPSTVRVGSSKNDLLSAESEPVQLKKGACLRMVPLQVIHPRQTADRRNNNRNKNRSLSSFPDPIDNVFSSRTAERLNAIVSWMQSQEKKRHHSNIALTKTRWQHSEDQENLFDTNNDVPTDEYLLAIGGKGIILSLSASQIHAITLKFLNKCLHYSHSTTHQHFNTNYGGVLLVLREKGASMVNWERIFREKSSFSLLNHANLSGPARKQLTTSRIAGFDIILTTFDAIKAKEKTFTTETMHEMPILGDTTMDQSTLKDNKGKWLDAASFSGDPIQRRCSKQLSCLHGLRWNKVIFVDSLGPQSYSLKTNTARAAAGRSLVALSR